ncbi:MAG TPA: ISL3 family transposase [Candidatus Tectomicrobia bacterium]|nr:ISL3 family transposase [Candidatus Tectomicrobia bacterium]
MTHELHKQISAVLPSTSTMHLTALTIEQGTVVLQLTATAPTATCPSCAVPSSAIHSRYQRHPTDLPWGTCAVRLQLMVRKFVCRNWACTRRIFTERLPDVVAPHARKTHRLITVLRALGVALGGNAGARLALRLRLPTSPASLLRLVRTAPVPSPPALQVVGIDEWAWRRGHRYGTILVNLADHRVVDLLPDRSAATVAAWLTEHPTIAVICRDRSDLYADGIRRGAPEAVQVVDRFHLVHNLRQVLEAVLIDHRPVLQAAAVGTAMALMPPTGLVPVTPMYRGRRRGPKPAPLQAERPPRHARWVTIYETIHRLHTQGTPIATMARQLGISRPTVYAYLRRDTPPGPRRLQRPPSARVLTPYVPYMIRRWRESGADSRQLYREIQTLGYTHSARTVGRFITQLRRAADAGQPPESQRSPYMRPQGPSARAVSFVMVCPAAKRSRKAQTYLNQLCQIDIGIARAHALSQAFLAIVRERRGEDLEAWMSEAMHSGITEVARFARGLQDDLRAIKAGLTVEWSNGATEGQIHRLKLVKRQGYGRAGFALLRQRVLQAA